MGIKLVVIALAILAVVSANEKVKRQSAPDLSEYWNQFKEQMKPITGQFPSLPNGFGGFPSFPGMGGSSGSSSGGSQYKRQISPNTLGEWFSQFQTGNLPFKPPTFGNLPFPGSSSSSSGSSESSQNENQ